MIDKASKFSPSPAPQPNPGPDPLRTRREEDKERRRAALLDAAEAVIAERGWDQANFGHIAARARLSRSLVYVYFPTREDLFEALCQRAMNSLASRFTAAAAAYPLGLDQLMGMGQAYYAFFLEEPLHFDLLARKETRPHDDLAAHSDPDLDGGARCLHLISEAIIRGIADGSVSPHLTAPATTAVNLWAFTHGLIQVAAKKEPLLHSVFGLTTADLMRNGFALMRRSLQA